MGTARTEAGRERDAAASKAPPAPGGTRWDFGGLRALTSLPRMLFLLSGDSFLLCPKQAGIVPNLGCTGKHSLPGTNWETFNFPGRKRVCSPD